MVEDKSIWGEKRGQFSFAFILVIMILGLIFLFFFMMPLLSTWMTSWDKASTKMTDISLRTANGLTDANVKAQFVEDIEAQQSASSASNGVLTSLIQFSGILVILLATLGLYIISKRTTESGMIG